MSDRENGKPVINCYDGNNRCVFSAKPKDGIDGKKIIELGEMIVSNNSDVVHDFAISDEQEGPVVRY